MWHRLQFQDRRDAASLRHRNRSEITVVMCEQKPWIKYGFRAGAKLSSAVLT